jgi:hypothetical protein
MDVHATGVDTATGALIIEDRSQPGLARSVFVGEVVRVRLTDLAPVEV